MDNEDAGARGLVLLKGSGVFVGAVFLVAVDGEADDVAAHVVHDGVWLVWARGWGAVDNEGGPTAIDAVCKACCFVACVC